MILTLITIGKTLEARAKGRTTSALEGLLRLAPKTATVVRDGVEMVVNVEGVGVGDIFIVLPVTKSLWTALWLKAEVQSMSPPSPAKAYPSTKK